LEADHIGVWLTSSQGWHRSVPADDWAEYALGPMTLRPPGR